MTTAAMSSTANRTKARRAVTGAPARADLVDAGFVLVLGLVALWGFRTTFDSPRFLFAGVVGLVLGIVMAHLANVLRQHWLVLALLVIATFFLFGGAVALSSDAIAGFLPNGSVLTRLATMTVSGWKDLLTTLPPVDGSGQFLVLPYLLALVFGSAAFLWARRTARPAPPAVFLGLLLVLVILLGTITPAGALAQGLAFAAVAFVWMVLRRRRTLRVVGTGAGLRSQAVIGAVLLGVSLALGALLGGRLPGTDTERTVLRTYVQPPFDITQYQSPLVGFRKYTEGAKKVWDQELFTVKGPKAGDLIRIAVLDDYSGTVWSASGGSGYAFRKVGSTIAPDPVLSSAKEERATVRVGAAYAGLNDANAWVPSVGYPTSLVFEGPRAKALADSLRYNPDTGQAIVAGRFVAGDSFSVQAAPVALVGQDFTAGSGTTIPSEETKVVSAKAVKWAEKKPSPWEQLQSVAKTLQAGAYSDGTRTGETQYLPGHGVARTTTFLGRQQLVGNDEQYASTFALMANSLGVPARVVMGAVQTADGAIRGQDIHAWVELGGSDGQWYAVPTATFMPDRNKTPEQQPKATAQDSNAADVPPPNSQRPPGSIDATFDTTSARVKAPTLAERLAALPGWVLLLLKVIGYPLVVLALVAGLLSLARTLRRRRRRTTGVASRQLAQGWRDYVDHARDLGIKVPAGLTRKEQAEIVGQAPMAATADGIVFGYGEPDSGAVSAFWSLVKRAKRDLGKTLPWHRRLRRVFSIRGLLFRDGRPVEHLQKPAKPARRGLPVLRKARA